MKRAAVFLTVLALAAALCGCDAANTVNTLKQRLLQAVATQQPQQDDVSQSSAPSANDIVIGMYDFDTFNPLVSGSQSVREAMEFVYEPLFTLDSHQNAVPVLAQESQLSSDGRTVRVVLKEGVRWHDGDVFNANDVEYTIARIREGQTQYTANLKNLAYCSVESSTVINLTFNWAAPNLVTLLTFPIIKDQTNISQGSSYNPIGTGPFRFDGKISGDRYQMSAFDGYRDGRAVLDHVYIDLVPDAESYLNMYGTGQFDVATSDIIDLSTYTPKGSVNLNSYVSNNITFIGCNNKNEKLAGSATRQALSKLVDREYIISSVIYSRGEAVEVPVNPSSPLYSDTPSLDIDVETAYNLLAQDGWESVPTGGFVKNINGSEKELSLTILVNSDNSERIALAQKIRDDFNEYGISASVETLSYESYMQRINSGQYELFIGSYKLDPTLDPTPLVTSAGNYFGYANSQVDTMIGQMGMTSNQEEQKALFAEFSQIMKNDMPFIPLYYSMGYMLSGARLENLSEPGTAIAYNGVSKWSVR